MDLQKTKQELILAFGPVAGMRIANVVLPNILKDFDGMLQKAPVFAVVKEEYRFDDMNGSIELQGCGGKITNIIIKAN